jgi:glycosyltransferase involved in cell wall biosynthesis
MFRKKNFISVGVDARTIFSNQRRGIGKVSLELYRHLIEMIPDCYFFFYYESKGADVPIARKANVVLRPIDMKGSRFDLWEQVRLPIATLKDKVDVLHCPGQTAPRINPVQTIVTIHDLIPLKIDDGLSQSYIKRFRRNIENSLKTARHIVTISEFSKNEIIKFFPAVRKKISIIYWAPFSIYQPINKMEAKKLIKEKYGIGEDFFFVYGAKAPRKNLYRAIEAFAQIKPKAASHLKLIISGVSRDDFLPFKEFAEKMGVCSDVISVGFLIEEAVPLFLNAAIALVYVSLYEGFGLPILEAFSCDCPVITSDCTSMPEIAGGAAKLVDPRDTTAISDAMLKFYVDYDERFHYIKLGRDRCNFFSWERSSKSMANIFTKMRNN